jgi:CubicO group peptidase (beta-lactamase class C family)
VGRRSSRRRRGPLLTALVAVALGVAACSSGPTAEDLAAVDYTPTAGEGWEVSSPAEQGLDPEAVAEAYWRADQLDSIYSLLIAKDGYLVAEDYFNIGDADQVASVQSVTKSYTGALAGIALADGCLPSIDEPMMTYFPELLDDLDDPRKEHITVQQLLQMRAGYAWEESNGELFDLLYRGFSVSSLVDVPLVRDPGTGWDYSNLSSHLLGIIVARACDTDLWTMARDRLFAPLGAFPGPWSTDWDGYQYGSATLHTKARDMAKFGQLYLDDGLVDGEQVVPAEWIEDSWQVYSPDAWYYGVGDNFGSPSYGYQWWTVTAGPHTYHLAWGHGGQQIAVLPELDVVVVVTADPLQGQHGDGPWRLEKANLNVVADFIAGLPAA